MTQYNTTALQQKLKPMLTPNVYVMFKKQLDHTVKYYRDWPGIMHVSSGEVIPEGFTPLAKFMAGPRTSIVCGKFLRPTWLNAEVPR